MALAKVIAFVSAKGGTGKTNIAASLGTLLVALGKKVLLVDLDYTTKGLSLLYLKEIRSNSKSLISKGVTPIGLYDELEAYEHAVPTILKNGLHIVPTDYSILTNINLQYDKTLPIMNRIREFMSSYDYILLDSQAGSNESMYVASHPDVSEEVIIVCEFDPMSAAGVVKLKSEYNDHLTYDRTWVLVNKLLPEFMNSYSDLLTYQKYLKPIPWDAAVVRAYAQRKLALNLEYGNSHTLELIKCLRVLLDDEIIGDINKFFETKATIMRGPLEKKYLALEGELASLYREKELITSRHYLKNILFPLTAALAAFLMGVTVIRFGEIFNWFNLGLSKENSNVWYYLFAGLVGIVTFLLLFFRMRTISRSVHLSEIDRIDRKMEYVRASLRELEILRKADAETLMKSDLS